MTYEEYKNKNKDKKNNSDIVKKILDKFFSIIIFVLIVLIISNYNVKFRNFLIDDVLNNTMDFSKVNNLIDKVNYFFKDKEVMPVIKEEEKKEEEYMDGKKIYLSSSDEVNLKSSGIITYIGDKEGYGNTIIVQQSNGYYAWYGNINESVKLYDYVESGNLIGRANDYYYYVLFKDDKPITNEN